MAGVRQVPRELDVDLAYSLARRRPGRQGPSVPAVPGPVGIAARPMPLAEARVDA